MMERIQAGQGRALDKMTNDNEYPKQIRNLQEQLRLAKEKAKEWEERVRKEERNSLVMQERMVSLEERCRELQAIVKAKNLPNTLNNEDDDQYSMLP